MLLRKRVLDLINNGVRQYEIAKVADKSKPTISRFVKGEHIEFSAALLIIKEFFPEEEMELIRDYRNYTDHMNERSALEYYILSGDKDSARHLIERLKESKNRHDNEFAKMYEVELMRLTAKIDPEEIIKIIESMYLETVEMKIYSHILKVYCYYELRCFEVAKNIIRELQFRTAQIKNKYLCRCYDLRIGQAYSVISLHENNVVECRQHNFQLVQNGLVSSLLASIHTTLGNSFTFEDPEAAISHLEKARLLYIEYNNAKSIRIVENSINFIQSYYNSKPSYLQLSDDVGDIHANAFYFITIGDKKKAIDLLDKVELDKLSDFTKGFHYFYRGEVSGDKNYYYDSVLCFRQAGDRFYRQLPINSLEKLGIVDDKLLKYLGI